MKSEYVPVSELEFRTARRSWPLNVRWHLVTTVTPYAVEYMDPGGMTWGYYTLHDNGSETGHRIRRDLP